MDKVAWYVPNTPSWVGGLNYFINLASALSTLPEPRIEPIVLGGGDSLPSPLCTLGAVPYPAGFGMFPFQLQRTFKAHNIRLFSHGWPLGRTASVPSLCWIPDFQHKRLPCFFSKSEIASRDRSFADIACEAQAVLVSSADAEKDFHNFFPKAFAQTHVLRFVAMPPRGADAAMVMARYDIAEPYFHIPNQLWKHKNHSLVLEALRILHASGSCPLVVSTGQTDDYRHPAYFAGLRKQVDEAGLTERFRFLGLMDFTHVGALMRSAIAMLNPSRFEGWSTTVEEGKSLGKRLLLSDIPVHREQAPQRGLYFDVDDAEALAALMREAMETYSPIEEERARQKAEAALPERMADFARTYENIVLGVLANGSSAGVKTGLPSGVDTRLNAIEACLRKLHALRWNLRYLFRWLYRKLRSKLR